MDAQNGNDQAVADKSASDTDAEEDDAEDCWEGRPNGHMAPERPFRGGEGAEGVFDPRYSLVFATLELCMCVLTRQASDTVCAIFLQLRISWERIFCSFS